MQLSNIIVKYCISWLGKTGLPVPTLSQLILDNLNIKKNDNQSLTSVKWNSQSLKYQRSRTSGPKVKSLWKL